MKIEMENAYLADEAINFRELFHIQQLQSDFLRRILECEERELFDYDRPLKYIPRVRKPLGERITNFVKQLVP